MSFLDQYSLVDISYSLTAYVIYWFVSPQVMWQGIHVFV